MTEPIITWHQPRVAPFEDAEFYDHGPIATVTLEGWDHVQGFTITIEVEGDRYLRYTADDDARIIRTVEQFRTAFPDGVTPSEGSGWEWENNGWFAIHVDGDDDGMNDGVDYSIAEALGTAEDYLHEKADNYDPTPTEQWQVTEGRDVSEPSGMYP